MMSNRKRRGINPSSLIQAVRKAENEMETRAALSTFSESERRLPPRSLPRMRLYDSLLR